MKRTGITTIIFLLLIMTSWAQTQTGVRSDAVSAEGVEQLELMIDNGFTIDIEGTETDSISYIYEFEGNELTYKAQFKDVDIDLEKAGSKVALSFDFPSFNNYKGNGNFIERLLHRLFGGETYRFDIEQQQLTIKVPRELSITSTTEFADITLTEVDGRHEIQNRSGVLNISNSQGELEVENAFGSTVIRDFVGDVIVSGPSADIKLQNIEGNVDSNGAFSEQDIRSIKGDLAVQNRSGSINIYDVQGHARIKSSFCNINMKNIQGWVSVTSRSGDLSMADMHDDVTIKGSFMDVEISNIEGELQAENESGSFKAAKVKGSVLFLGSYSNFDLVQYQGHELKLKNRSGDIHVQAMKKLNYVNIENNFDDVDMVLAEPFEGQLHLESTFGSIQTNLPVQMQGDNPEDHKPLNGDRIIGWIGSEQNDKLKIIVANGSIKIESNITEL
jgi:hypothetical protein